MDVVSVFVAKWWKKWWKELAVLLLLAAAFGTSMYYSNRARTAEQTIVMKDKDHAVEIAKKDEAVKQCQEVKNQYTNIYNGLSDLKKSVDTSVIRSQNKINSMQSERERILNEMNKINLRGLTCEQKFEWLKQQAISDDTWKVTNEQ